MKNVMDEQVNSHDLAQQEQPVTVEVEKVKEEKVKLKTSVRAGMFLYPTNE